MTRVCCSAKFNSTIQLLFDNLTIFSWPPPPALSPPAITRDQSSAGLALSNPPDQTTKACPSNSLSSRFSRSSRCRRRRKRQVIFPAVPPPLFSLSANPSPPLLAHLDDRGMLFNLTICHDGTTMSEGQDWERGSRVLREERKSRCSVWRTKCREDSFVASREPGAIPMLGAMEVDVTRVDACESIAPLSG